MHGVTLAIGTGTDSDRCPRKLLFTDSKLYWKIFSKLNENEHNVWSGSRGICLHQIKETHGTWLNDFPRLNMSSMVRSSERRNFWLAFLAVWQHQWHEMRTQTLASVVSYFTMPIGMRSLAFFCELLLLRNNRDSYSVTRAHHIIYNDGIRFIHIYDVRKWAPKMLFVVWDFRRSYGMTQCPHSTRRVHPDCELCIDFCQFYFYSIRKCGFLIK